MIDVWNQPQHKYDDGPTGRERRKLRHDEKVENDPEHWDSLARHMDIIAERATQLAKYARHYAGMT
jgi:hypothetical protein